jgi:DNA-binding transcriptional MerR regulator
MSTGNKHYTIGEISELTGIKQTVLRFWEKEFPKLTPVKNKFGHRVYEEKHIEMILKIKSLLYEKGLTIKGAKDILDFGEDKLINKIFLRSKIRELLDILKRKDDDAHFNKE